MTTLAAILDHIGKIKRDEEDLSVLEIRILNLRAKINDDRTEARIRTVNLYKEVGRFITHKGVIYDVYRNYPEPIIVKEDPPCPPAPSATANTG